MASDQIALARRRAPSVLTSVLRVKKANRPSELDREDGGRIDHLIQRNPMSSVLTGFGLGLGFGLVVTLLFGRRRDETWFERTMPAGFQHLPERLKRVPESLGSYVPASWKHS